MSTFNLPDSIEHLRDYIRDLLNGIIETEYIERVFSGVMNLEDFTDYVVFEVCTEQYLRSVKTYSLLCHIQHLKEDHKNYLRDLQCLNRHSQKIKDVESFDENSLYHGLRPYLSDMVDKRSAELNCADHPDAPKSVNDLLAFDSSDPKEQWKGYPITLVHFLQAYTSYVLGIKNQKYVLRSADKNLTPDKARFGYERQDYFLEFISWPVYRDNFTDEECDRYIANAINLSRYENAYFRNTLYTYTYHLPDPKARPSFISGTIPPIFLGSISTEGALGYCLASAYLPWHLCIRGLCRRNMNVRKPYLFMKDYARIFASAEDSQRLEEELRFYAIQILAAGMIHLVKDHPSMSNITPKDFASFIHNRYNIVDEMLHQAAIHDKSGFNAHMVSAMRAITKDHNTQYGFTN